MKKEVIFDANLHFEHKRWRSELDFWEDEFILHGGVIDSMQEGIEKHEASIVGHSQLRKEIMDVALVKKHVDFRERMETQRQIYADLKKEFFRFLTKYM